MEADNILVPWIYLRFNKDLTGSQDPKADGKKSVNMNTSKTAPFQAGTSTNINKSQMGFLGPNATSNQFNSNINDSGAEIDMEFGFMTDEDSIFNSFT